MDILGNEIESLGNEEKTVGTYDLTWNAVNLPSGVYFYWLQAGDFVQTRKMILLK
ncbi:MAG: T9SS type A sorting domain-containing protein [Ignavibacteriales bacterium]|nr:T9SS type A sorting domain-containing protein [Ignavibacteriales bacterium]